MIEKSKKELTKSEENVFIKKENNHKTHFLISHPAME
jgi:hypothetical protein